MVVLIPIFTTLFKMAMAMLWNIFSIHVLTILFYFINTVVIWYYHDPNSNFPPKNFISEFVMRNERKVFGDGYCVVWAIYSSLYVFEKVGHYSFNFDNIIYATGGNMGLFLGWSLKSIFIDFIEFLYQNLKKNAQT